MNVGGLLWKRDLNIIISSLSFMSPNILYVTDPIVSYRTVRKKTASNPPASNLWTFGSDEEGEAHPQAVYAQLLVKLILTEAILMGQ